jgi:hypothetical protein
VIRLAILVAVQAVALWGCITGGELRAPTPGETVVAEPSDRSGHVASSSLTPDGATGVTGRLGFDSVEGGCNYVETDDGTRYQVIYPDPWRLDRSTGHLLGPNGQDISPGSVITVHGSIAKNMASICQMGPMFRATAVFPG